MTTRTCEHTDSCAYCETYAVWDSSRMDFSTAFLRQRVGGQMSEDVEWLIDIAIELEPEDGCLTVFGPDEQWFYALTKDGVENLKELIQIHRTGR